ncbi:MAG: hypothetical protein AB8G22_10235 [Saprospiraceae bacterium]
MKEGLSAFQLKTPKEVIETHEIIKQHGLALPPKYSVFCTQFKLGIDFMKGSALYMSEKICINDSLRSFFSGGLNHPKLKDLFIGFYGLEDALEHHFSQVNNQHSMLTIHELFPIGSCDGQADICVGISKKNIDKIYFVEHEFQEIEEIYVDVFSLVNDFTMGFHKWFKESNISPNQLYKNWDEDFWRIRQADD